MAIVEQITSVFEAMGNWIVSAITSALPIFWDDANNTLTVLGVLACCSLAVGIFLMVVGIIQRFIGFGA